MQRRRMGGAAVCAYRSAPKDACIQGPDSGETGADRPPGHEIGAAGAIVRLSRHPLQALTPLRNTQLLTDQVIRFRLCRTGPSLPSAHHRRKSITIETRSPGPREAWTRDGWRRGFRMKSLVL